MRIDTIPPAGQSEESKAKDMSSTALLGMLIARHPFAAATFFFIYWNALGLALGRLLEPLVPIIRPLPSSFLLYETLAEFLMALIVALPILLLRWWRETGFTRGINWWGIVICIFPIIVIAGPSALGLLLGVGEPSALVIVFAILLTLLVGCAEEGLFRGLLLRSLLPRGIWPAVLISSLFFAGTHLLNLLSGASLSYVAGQMLQAFGAGVLLAALRLRTGSIWPGIVLHASRDIVGMLLLGMGQDVMTGNVSPASFIVDGVFCALFVINALILLRPSQKRKLALAYGLAKPPVILPTTQPWPYAGYPYAQGYPPYPTQAGQPSSASLSANPPLTDQPHPGTISYQEYTSPAAYGEQLPAADPESASLYNTDE